MLIANRDGIYLGDASDAVLIPVGPTDRAYSDMTGGLIYALACDDCPLGGEVYRLKPGETVPEPLLPKNLAGVFSVDGVPLVLYWDVVAGMHESLPSHYDDWFSGEGLVLLSMDLRTGLYSIVESDKSFWIDGLGERGYRKRLLGRTVGYYVALLDVYEGSLSFVRGPNEFLRVPDVASFSRGVLSRSPRETLISYDERHFVTWSPSADESLSSSLVAIDRLLVERPVFSKIPENWEVFDIQSAELVDIAWPLALVHARYEYGSATADMNYVIDFSKPNPVPVRLRKFGTPRFLIAEPSPTIDRSPHSRVPEGFVVSDGLLLDGLPVTTSRAGIVWNGQVLIPAAEGSYLSPVAVVVVGGNRNIIYRDSGFPTHLGRYDVASGGSFSHSIRWPVGVEASDLSIRSVAAGDSGVVFNGTVMVGSGNESSVVIRFSNNWDPIGDAVICSQGADDCLISALPHGDREVRSYSDGLYLFDSSGNSQRIAGVDYSHGAKSRGPVLERFTGRYALFSIGNLRRVVDIQTGELWLVDAS